MKFFSSLSILPLVVLSSSSFRPEDIVKHDVWKSYFQDSPDPKQVEYLNGLTEEKEPSAPPSLVALAFCLVKNGKGIHSKLKKPFTYDTPKGFSLVEALFSQFKINNTQKLIIDPLDFVAIWELSHGSDVSSATIEYSDSFAVPDFEFSSAGNAKATMYALLTLSHVNKVNFGLAGKLLRSITSECYEKMRASFSGLFDTLQFLDRPIMNHFFISVNTEYVPKLRAESSRYSEDNGFGEVFDLETEEEVECILALALLMSPRQILHVNSRLKVDQLQVSKVKPKVGPDFTSFDEKKCGLFHRN